MTNKLTFGSNTYQLEEYESVLECLLRNGEQIPYACKAGTCRACLVKTVDCTATETATKWIKQTLRNQGFALACQWIPEDDVAAQLPSIEEFSVEVSIRELVKLNQRVMKLVLDVKDKADMFHYYPGQYLSLINPQGITRSYSIANNYEQDGFLELHISQTLHGTFTKWLFDKAAPGDVMHIRGPAGDCFYIDADEHDYPIVLAGTGTGLAPLYGILRESLSAGHSGPISLFQGGRKATDLYYRQELEALAAAHENFSYHPCAIESDSPDAAAGLTGGALETVVLDNINQDELGRTHVFLCGNPDLVYRLRKKIFLQGVKSSNIFCDPFIERTVSE